MKRSIGKKLVFSYLILIVITLTVSGVLFYAMIRQYMVAEAKASLRTEASHLIKLLGSNEAADLGPLKRRIITEIALGMVESDYFVVEKGNLQVIVSSSPDIVVGARSPLALPSVFQGEAIDAETNIQNREIVYVALPFSITSGNRVTHALVLFTELEQIRNVTKSVMNLAAKGFFITVAVMLLIALGMTRSLLRPLQKLREAVLRLSKRDFTPPDIVRTGDEWEEFSRAFRNMTIELKQYDEGQRRFLQNASHELKTPLMAIQGYAEGIRDGIFQNEDADRVLDVISAESIRLKKLVDELIYLSKLETLDEMYQPQWVELKPIVEESIVRVESLAGQKEVSINLTGEGGTRLRVDPDKFMQAMINLLANGIRHARQTITVQIVASAEVVQVKVADDGSGFREEDKDRIFERFFRGDMGETGLGLAITRAIIEKNGGTIRADNLPSGGAVFTIQFPIRK